MEQNELPQRTIEQQATRRRSVRLVGLLLGALLLAACGTEADVSVGPSGTSGGATSSSRAPATTPPTSSLCLLKGGGTVPCDPSNLPVSDPPIIGIDCHGAPASTAVGMPGGGEIVCAEVPGQSEPGFPGETPGGPPMTTVPGGDDQTVSTIVTDPPVPLTTTTLVPGPNHGVLRGTATGGLDCAPDQPCPAIGIIVSGSVQAYGPDGTPAATPATIDGFGMWGLRLPPGTYRLVVRADGADRCDEQRVAVVADQVLDVNLQCTRPAR